MNPKEKAKELLDKYGFVYIPNYTSNHEVKQCALIAVDEIIAECDKYFEAISKDRVTYWQQVKTEIENL